MNTNLNVDDIVNKAQEMQGQFKKMQEAFEKKRVVGTAGVKDDEAIFVEATIDGGRMLIDLAIGQDVLKEDSKVLTDLIIAAVNNATDKLNQEMQKEVKKIYELPGALRKE